MSTHSAKRKNGFSFFRITDKGKTIKDYDLHALRILINKHNKNLLRGLRLYDKHKSLLWKICIDNDLI